MGIIRNTTEGIYPYQQALYNKIAQGGFKAGEMQIISSGRQSGKSMLNAIYNNNLCKEITLPGQEYLQLVELKMGFADLTTNRINQRKKVKQYNFSRANWYVAEFRWQDQPKVLAWCSQQFGPHPANPDAWSRWHNRYVGKIMFRDAKDYEWFALRWS